jgi:glyoxylase-like metal-dependent hydrolase (beta-lactamase superfamily II)
MEGVRAVYGDEIAARDYGELVPIPEDRVLTPADNTVIELGGRALRCIETPGHALHHICIWDEASKGWFTGDTFGLAYPALATSRGAHVIPATAPVQFDPQALHASVARMLEAQPQVIYMTHYGAVPNPALVAQQLLSQIDAMVEAARALAGETDRHAKLKAAFRDIYVNELRRCGSALPDARIDELLAMDVELNAQGLGVWLDKKKVAST